MINSESIEFSKGDQLELAVEFLEKCIFQEISRNSVLTIDIKRKHKKRIKGVTHEVDLYVKIDLKNGYTTIFIFECKNWTKNKVNKNEIISFSEKINAFEAQKGFFIGTKFSRDARNQAKLNQRISIHIANNYELSTLDFVVIDLPSKRKIHELTFFEPNEIPGITKPKVIEGEIKFKVNNQEFNYSEFVSTLIKSICTKEFIKEKLGDNYMIAEVNCKDYYQFPKNSFYINGILYDKAFINFSITIERCYPSLKFGYDIENRGKYMRLEAEASEGIKLVIHEYKLGN